MTHGYSGTAEAQSPPKTGVIKKSKKAYGDRITGHSPRRSGAMFYVRQGLPIQELAFLERWNSSVVLQYAEEALQEKAVELPQCAPWTPMTLAPLTPAPVTPAIQAVANPGTPAPTPPESQDQSFASVFNKPGDLWVVTKGRGWKNRPKHWITKATWSLPIKAWSTACGWHFASQSADFYFFDRTTGGRAEVQQMLKTLVGATKSVRPKKRQVLWQFKNEKFE